MEILKTVCFAAALCLAAITASASGLPEGTVIDPPANVFPAQRLKSEIAGGKQSFLVALGNTVFSSPYLFGKPAQDGGLSCNACHVNGHVNRAFFIPGMSQRPAGLDPTGPHFNPAADDGVANHVDIPSLRGVRVLGPYGRDGRIGSLREFTRHVIVTEFGGAEPEALMLDALVAYMNEFEFLPNSRINASGKLNKGASAAEARGEKLFHERRTASGQTCAGCHVPDAAFVDKRVHDVGSGGFFRTPTLLNVASSGPYGHDGRWSTLEEAVAALDQALGFHFTATERADIAAYIKAVGAADDEDEPATFRREMAELASYVALLDTTVAEGDTKLTRFVVDTVNAEFRRVERAFPQGDAPRQANRPDRRKQEVLDYAALRAGLEQVAQACEASRPKAALEALHAYRALAGRMIETYPEQ